MKTFITLLLFALAFSARADIGLAHACLDPPAQAVTRNTSGNDCVTRGWVRPTADTFVLSATSAATAVWGNADFRFRRFADLPATAVVDVCNLSLTPGAFGATDPCGTSNANKGPVPKSQVQVAAAIGTGKATISWQPVTMVDDIDSGKVVASRAATMRGYRIYYGPSADMLTQTVDAGNVLTYTLEGLAPGPIVAAVAAYTDQAEGQRSGVVSKVIAEGPKTIPRQVTGVTIAALPAYDLTKSDNLFRMTQVGTLPAGTAYVPGYFAIIGAQAYCLARKPTSWRSSSGTRPSTVFVTC
jgi:hypothetical protein